MWLTGRLAPDFKTIADFCKDNGAAIQAVCTQSTASKAVVALSLPQRRYPMPVAAADLIRATQISPRMRPIL
jgi:hypothetical protein